MTTRLRQVSLLSIVGWLIAAASVVHAAEPSVADLLAKVKSADESARLQAMDQLGSMHEKAATAVAPLIETLKDNSAMVRAHAARALGEIGAPAKPATAALILLLKDPDEKVRRQAIMAIGAIRPGPLVTVPLFIGLMEDSDPGVRMRVLNAVTEGGARAVPALTVALKKDKAVYWACLVLREIGPAAKDAVPALTETLASPRPEVQREALLALAAIGEPAAPAIPKIAGLLDNEQLQVPATYALTRLGKIPADAEAKIRTNAKSDDKLLRSTSLWALAMIHPDDKQIRQETAEQLVANLKDQDPYVRVMAARALAALPPAPEINIPIFEREFKNADEATMRYALDALAALGPRAVPRLIDILKFKAVRVHAILILGEMGPAAADATEALAKLIDDENPRVATEAVLALAKIGPGAKAAVPALIEALEKDKGLSAHAVAYALGKIGPDAAAAEPVLSSKLKSPDLPLAEVSAWALVQIHPTSPDTATKVVPVLITGLSSPLLHSRRGAAETLGELGPAAKDALPALQKAAADEDKTVRDAAVEAIKRIGGGTAAPTSSQKGPGLLRGKLKSS